MKFRTLGKITVGCLAASTLIACGPDEKDGEPVAVTHQSATQSIEANTTNISASLAASLQMLETSEIFQAGVDSVASDGGDVACADFNDSEDCVTPEPEPLDIDGAVNEGSDALVQVLRENIFVDANIETESTTEITYLLRGDVICPAFEGTSSTSPDTTEPIEGSGTTDETMVEADNSGCIDSVDQAEIRLRVTSPVPNDIDVAVFVGPQRYNPASFQFHQDLLAAELDFAGLKGAIEHISDAVGEEAPELPEQMAGRVRGELRANGADSVTWGFSVLTPVDIEHPDLSLQVAAADPAASLTIDGGAMKIESTSSFGAVDLGFIVRSYSEYMDESGEWIEDSSETAYDLNIAGGTGTAVFDVANERLDITGLGLGNGTTTMAIDGAQVLSIDLNANDGRTLDASISNAGSDEVLIEVSPILDLAIGLDFQNAPEEGEAWMENETMTILLDGDAKPAILAGEAGIEVLRGKLSMGLARDGGLIEVEAGQCLLDAPVETTDGSEPVEPVEPVETTPLEQLVVGSCG